MTGTFLGGSGSRPMIPNTNQRGSQLFTATQDGQTLYSTIAIEVDEFKFFKILRNVLAKTPEYLQDLNHFDDVET
jgi:hypothetical protein